MQFQVKGQEYFLAFVEDEGRWYVFAPSGDGLQRIPVYVDAPVGTRNGALGQGQSNVQSKPRSGVATHSKEPILRVLCIKL